MTSWTESCRLVRRRRGQVVATIRVYLAQTLCDTSTMRTVTAAQRAQRRWGGIRGRFFLRLIPLFALVLTCTAAYNRWAFLHYRSVYPSPGRVYAVDGLGMHLFCTGSGIPTVILESGLGDDARIWGKVQPELSKLTRVCSYDRAGLGWSDPRPDQRDSNSIADQLHRLLAAAEISGPIVLMGHSIAGLHMRAYLSKYPHAIAGVVFVDAATPDYILRIRESYGRFIRHLVWIKPLMTLGLGRLAGRCGSDPPHGMEAYASWYRADNYCNPSYPTAWVHEVEGFEASAREVTHTGPFLDLPILIFSRDLELVSSGSSGTANAQDTKIWNDSQEELKQLSSRSSRIIVRRSTHYIHIDRADLLNREVSLFIRQLRGDIPPHSDYGSTRTE